MRKRRRPPGSPCKKATTPRPRSFTKELIKQPKHAALAAVGLSKAREAQGKYDDALAAVDAALKAEAADADLLGRRAELLYHRGRWDDAKQAAQAALKKSPDHLLARWIDAQILRDSGDWPKADEAFRWFVRHYSQRSDADMEITNPEELLIIGLAGLERARYHHIADQFEFVLNDVFAEAAKNDKLFWQANFEIGRVYNEKHNKAAAAKAFDKALAVNPRAADIFAARAETAYQQFEMKDADFFAGQALGINPNLPEALRVKAAIHLFSGEYDAAMKALDKARKVNPRDEATLAQVAAVFHAQKRQKEFDAVLAEVETFNPKAWRFNVELGGHLDSRKLFFDSGKYFKLAIELEPKMPEGYEGLGMLEMRLGKRRRHASRSRKPSKPTRSTSASAIR